MQPNKNVQNQNHVQSYQGVDRRKLLFAGALVVVVAIVGILIYALVEIPKTSTLVVGVGPKDAKILIDGKKYENRTYKMRPGTYHVTIEREGYQTQESEVVLEKGATGEVRACLTTDGGNEDWWHNEGYTEGENGYYCQAYYDMLARRAQAEMEADNKIFSLMPYKNYEDGYMIAAQEQEGGKVKVIISLLYCKIDLQQMSKEMALEWMRGKGLDPETYDIEISILCEDLEPERW